MSSDLKKIKQVIKKRDNRFWLMVFVVFSTSFVFVFWISSLGERVPAKSESDTGIMAIKDELQEDVTKTFDDFLKMMEEGAKKNTPKVDSSVIDITKIEKAINDKKNEIETEEIASSTPSEELEDNEEAIESLRKRIEELEKNLQEK